MEMNVAICDDNIKDLECTTKIISDTFKEHNMALNLHKFTKPTELLNKNKEKAFDAIFLDLDMPEINGMEVAASINKLNESTEIVFITNHDELVYKAYRFKALGFIRKKYLHDEFHEIFDTLIESVSRQQNCIVFHDMGIERKYDIKDIVFMQSADHYVDVFLSNGSKDTVRGSINAFEESYSHCGFIRVHSRYLVNYRHIFSIEKSTIVLNDHDQVPLSRSRINDVKKPFNFF